MAIAIDGVLAKRSQYVLDALATVSLDSPVDASKLPLSLEHSNCKCGKRPDQVSELADVASDILRRSPDCWSSLEAYEDVDFDELNRAMAEGEFLGHFVASRFPTQSDTLYSDHRYATKAWLDAHCRTSFQSYSLNVDLCRDRVPDWLQLMNVGFYLSSDAQTVMEVNAVGIHAALINRSWNLQACVPFRVNSVAEFLQTVVN